MLCRHERAQGERGSLGVGRSGSRGEHLREPQQERASHGRRGAERDAGEISVLAFGRQSDHLHQGWMRVTECSPRPPLAANRFSVLTIEMVLSHQLFWTCCQPWAGVLDANPCPSPLPWLRPQSGNWAPNFPLSSFSSYCHPHPTPLPPRTQEIPEPAACDASSSRSPASGDLAGSPGPRGSGGVLCPREGTRLRLPAFRQLPLRLARASRSHRVSLWVSTFFLSVAEHLPGRLGSTFPFSLSRLRAACLLLSQLLWLCSPERAVRAAAAGTSRGSLGGRAKGAVGGGIISTLPRHSCTCRCLLFSTRST